jgi:hypothetical protein
MKIITAVIKTVLNMAFVAFCAAIVAFFVTVFYAEGVLRAIEVIKSIM